MDSSDLKKFMGDDTDDDLLPEFPEDSDVDDYVYGMMLLLHSQLCDVCSLVSIPIMTCR